MIKKDDEVRIVPTLGLNNCGGRCIIRAHVRNGTVEKLTTDAACHEDGTIPLTACVKGMNYHKTFLGEDRLRYPMKRVGKRGEGRFERISWEEAVDIIAREWIRIRDTYGPGSRFVHYSTGVEGILRGNRLAKRLLCLDGGYLDYYNSYSTACITPATKLMYGTNYSGHDPADWLHTDLLILWGHNPAETRFDYTMHILRQAKAKGIPIVVVDPRKNDTILELQAEWIPIRPGTDAAMQDAMAYVILAHHLEDRAFLERCCLGFDKGHMPDGVDPGLCYEAYLTGEQDGIPKTPQWAESITGVPARTIEELALRYAKADRAALIQGYGAQRHAYGEQGVRGGITLACMTGNVGISGGWASGHAEFVRHHFPAYPGEINPYKPKIPVYGWTQALADGVHMTKKDGVKYADRLDSNIKMIINLAGNTLVNQHGDINATKKLLEDESLCEFIVVSDLFMTASARYADILLPGCSFLECENICVPWKYGDFIGFNNKVVEPLYESRFEYDWLTEVAEKLGLKDTFTKGRTAGEWLEALYEECRADEPELPPYEEFKEAGIYRFKNNPEIIAFEKECRDPEMYPFPTKSGKIEIFSKEVYETEYSEPFPAIPRYMPIDREREEEFPLQLIGWHTKRRSHSVHDNNRALHKIDPQRVWMHPDDAAKRGICDGDMVEITNQHGRIRIPAHVTDRIMAGVSALSQGAWHVADEDGTDVAGSINVLTSLKRTPYAQGNPQHTNFVEIKKAVKTGMCENIIMGII